ncbi:TIGR00266 family protein [Erysipelotrichaceae bacterium]|nr:TIGR00266 family protein [Erysipelotrichaceae bacterium]
MKYEIKGGQFPVVVFQMDEGDQVFSEAGGMSWMTSNIKMETNTGGGLLKGLGRTFAGESMFFNYYKALANEQMISFASGFPGKIMPIELDGTYEIIAQKRAFLVGTTGVDLKVTFVKKFGAGLFGGEGFILQKFSGNGVAFLEIDGDVVEYELKEGEKLLIDQTHLAAMDTTVSFSIERVKGIKNILFGGEGLFLGTLTGPGRVWIQTMPFSKMMGTMMAGMGSK